MDMTAALPYMDVWKKNDPMESIVKPLRTVPAERLELFRLEVVGDLRRTTRHRIDMDFVTEEDRATLLGIISAFTKEVQKDIYLLEDKKNRKYCKKDGYRDLRDSRSDTYTSPYGLGQVMMRSALQAAGNFYQFNRWRAVQAKILENIRKKQWYKTLNKTEKDYIWSLLRTVNDDFFAVVDGKYPPPPEGVDGSQIENLRGLCGAIRHEFKKCFTPAPVLKQKRSAWIDRDCWTWKTIDGVTYIRFTTLEKGERIELRLKGVRAFPLRKGRVLDGKTGKAWNKGAAMGILVYTPQGFFFDVGTPLKVEEHVNALGEDADKAVCRSYDQGVTETLMDDGGYAYGEGFREVLSRSSESFTARHSERQKFEALARNTDDPEKKANVIENNLGRERYEAFLFRVKQSAADFVNRALNDAVRKALSDGVDWLVLENLRHAFQFGEGLPLGIKRVFVWWLHGFIIKRLLFKASKHGLKVALVPSAYSSQGCPSCFYTYYGNRRGDHFKCQACKSEFHSDRVGAVNLLHRLHSSHWWPDMTVDQSWRAARLDYEEECARRGTTPLPEKRRPRSGVKRTKSSGTPSQKTNRNA